MTIKEQHSLAINLNQHARTRLFKPGYGRSTFVLFHHHGVNKDMCKCNSCFYVFLHSFYEFLECFFKGFRRAWAFETTPIERSFLKLQNIYILGIIQINCHL